MPKRKVTKEKGSTKKGLSTRAAASITHSRKSRAFRAQPTALGTNCGSLITQKCQKIEYVSGQEIANTS